MTPAAADAASVNGNRRRERRLATAESNALARVLGTERPATPCRIVDMSRSGMRIALTEPFPVSGQVYVEWDRHYFVGYGRHMQAKDGCYVLGLELVSCSYSGTLERWALEIRGLIAHWESVARSFALKLLRKR